MLIEIGAEEFLDYIDIKGAREHNLKNIDVKIPRDKFVVITGLSGSGKSSLAFDTIYAEGQRRYVESLSSYARQFLGQMEKPDVDYIEGLSPAISIDQKTTNRNPRSTVGTVTEIHDYLRILFARAGVPHCTVCGKPIERQSVDQMIDRVFRWANDTRLNILSPVVRAKKGEHKKLLEDLERSGYSRVRVDGEMYEFGDDIDIIKNNKHSIEVVIDRLKVKPENKKRIADSIEAALKLSGGLVILQNGDTGEQTLMNENYSCSDCGISIEEISPRMFSFNSPYGACPACTGLGSILKIDPALLVPDDSKTLAEGAVRASGWNLSMWNSWNFQNFIALSKKYGFSMEVPYRELSEEAKKLIMYGSGDEEVDIEYKSDRGVSHYHRPFEGMVNNLERRFLETSSEAMKAEISEYMFEMPCTVCGGKRYKPETLAVLIGKLNIAELSELCISEIRTFLHTVELNSKQAAVADRVLRELDARLTFLVDVGLAYLTLSRSAGTLSGGEAQRIRLATQIGSGLVGVLYILDEPSIGLHQRDNKKLLNSLKGLRDLGNTLLVVEHDEETMREADYILDMGPGAGVHGGEVVAIGTPEQIMKCKESVTGKYLSHELTIPVPENRRPMERGSISIKEARENNLKSIDVDIPIGVITGVTGVSGSGKSTLINEILYKATAKALNGSRMRPGKFTAIAGLENFDKVIDIDQSPIGRTPRSNPATYTGVFDHIRDLFAATKDAKMRGYNKGRFSFNVKGGRCEACRGDGIIKIEMHFLPDVYVPCEVCGAKRYTRQTLEVEYKGKNIFEVLDMTVEDAREFFAPIPKIAGILNVLYDVGLGYIKLGQPSTTLSGGEAQRIKLAYYLSKRQTGKTLFILDEPTTGLHSADVQKLISIIDQLADKGNTVVIIEHNLDVIKCCDYIIDLGPEGGDAGGEVIATGTPEQIASSKHSATGEYLKKVLL